MAKTQHLIDSAVSLNDITISNEFRSGDMGYIIHMHGRIYREEFDFELPFEGYVIESLLEFYRKYDPARSRIWICRHGNTIVGCLMLMDRGDAAQLRYFIIEKGYRSIGMGKKLMKLFMEAARSIGYPKVYLLTTDGLPASAHLYKSYGFELTEQRPSSDFGRPVMEQRYDLNL